jgi:hypothetical protein
MGALWSRTELQSFLRSIQTLYSPADLENFSRYVSQAVDGLIPCETDKFPLKSRAANFAADSKQTNDYCASEIRRWPFLQRLRNRKSRT